MREPADSTPVVTGTGLVTALGFGVDASFAALLEGRSGIRPTGDVPLESGCGLAALVEPPYLRVEVPDSLRTQVKFLNGSGELAVEAAHEAHVCAAWTDTDATPEESGLWLSQIDTWDWHCGVFRPALVEATDDLTRPLEEEALNRAAARRTKPFFLLDSLKNNAFSFLTRWWNLRGANTSVAGFAGGTLGLLDLAARATARGDQVRALVVGAGRAANGVARRDLLLQGLSRPAETPTCRPLDVAGNGVAPGEGAAAVAIERLETAKARGAVPRAALLGHGSASGSLLDDGIPAPRPDTVRLAASGALEEAEIEAGDLLGIVLPASGLARIDRALLEGIDGIPAAAGAPAVSWRGATGHMALASELAEIVLAVEVLRVRRLPGTTGLEDPLPAAGRPLPTAPVEGTGRAVLVLTSGLQGETAAAVVAAVD